MTCLNLSLVIFVFRASSSILCHITSKRALYNDEKEKLMFHKHIWFVDVIQPDKSICCASANQSEFHIILECFVVGFRFSLDIEFLTCSRLLFTMLTSVVT